MREFFQHIRTLLSVTILLVFVTNSCNENSANINSIEEVSVDVDSSDPVDSPEKYQVMLDTSQGEKIHILSIGITHYNDPVITETLYADNDAKIFAGLWQGCVPQTNIHLLTDEKATKPYVKQLIADKLSLVSHGDFVYIFFAGHGDIVEKADREEVSGLLLYDAKPHQVETYYLIQELMEDLKKHIKAKSLLLILDSCHSGAAGLLRSADKKAGTKTIDAKEIEKQISRVGYNWGILTACRPDEKSRASHEYRQGFFTYWLKLGLVGWADRGSEDAPGKNDGEVTFKELFDFIYERVREDTRGNQTPVRSSLFHTETVMCKTGDTLPDLIKAGSASALLEIKVKPADAKVTCGGKDITSGLRQGDFKIIMLKLKPGKYDLRVTSNGYIEQKGKVSLIGGERSVVIAQLKTEIFPPIPIDP